MSTSIPTQVPGDKMKKAIKLFSELLQLKPEKSREALLRDVEIQFDLSPLECEFLHKHFREDFL